ncbi:MAG: NAD-dependent epimerase/dehydratase family protein, partial [Planctomycetota bacterium]
PQKEKVAIDENCSCSPIKGYGESKFLAENEVKKLGGNINWTIIRPPFIFGPYDYDTLLVFKLIKYGVKLYMGQKFFSFVFSQDLAQAIIKIMDNNKSFGKTYFVCYPKYTSQTTFLNTISYFVNKNAKWVRIHPNFFVAGATLLQPILKKNSPINRIKFKEIKQNYWLCCPEKIKKELSIECKTSLENAVRKTYEWYKINNLI